MVGYDINAGLALEKVQSTECVVIYLLIWVTPIYTPEVVGVLIGWKLDRIDKTASIIL